VKSRQTRRIEPIPRSTSPVSCTLQRLIAFIPLLSSCGLEASDAGENCRHGLEFLVVQWTSPFVLAPTRAECGTPSLLSLEASQGHFTQTSTPSHLQTGLSSTLNSTTDEIFVSAVCFWQAMERLENRLQERQHSIHNQDFRAREQQATALQPCDARKCSHVLARCDIIAAPLWSRCRL
jgi:hypothetical protein